MYLLVSMSYQLLLFCGMEESCARSEEGDVAVGDKILSALICHCYEDTGMIICGQAWYAHKKTG